MLVVTVLTVDYGSVFDYIQEWETAIANNSTQPILVLRYEDIKQVGTLHPAHPRSTVRRHQAGRYTPPSPSSFYGTKTSRR